MSGRNWTRYEEDHTINKISPLDTVRARGVSSEMLGEKYGERENSCGKPFHDVKCDRYERPAFAVETSARRNERKQWL